MIWLSGKEGDHPIVSEGSAWAPAFSADGSRLYFLMSSGTTRGNELGVQDLATGKVEKVLPGYDVDTYAISRDGKRVVFSRTDRNGRSGLWIANTDHRSSPIHLESAAIEDSPFFLPDGDIVFRAVEGGLSFLYRMKADGTGRRKITPERILDPLSVSPDGRWFAVSAPGSDVEYPAATKAFAVDGGQTVQLCLSYCQFNWDTSGKFVYIFRAELGDGSYVMPVQPATGLPKLPPLGIARKEDFAASKKLPWYAPSAVGASLHAYIKQNTRRNIYRIQLQ